MYSWASETNLQSAFTLLSHFIIKPLNVNLIGIVSRYDSNEWSQPRGLLTGQHVVKMGEKSVLIFQPYCMMWPSLESSLDTIQMSGHNLGFYSQGHM